MVLCVALYCAYRVIDTVRVALDAGGDAVFPRVAFAAVVATANGLLLFSVSRLSQVVRDLEVIRAATAGLEVAGERLRVARHLRETVGGRLASIIAACRGTDAGRDGDEARAVAAAAREALAEVRTVAGDYRDRSLAGEVAAARTVLTAAGVEVTAGTAPAPLPGPVDALLGTILRRTVIDTLRTAPPRGCRIEMDASAWLRVSFTGGVPGPAAPHELAEEVERLGGRLLAGPGDVDVRIPVRADHPVSSRRPRLVSPMRWLAFVTMAALEIDLFVTTVVLARGGWNVFALIVPLSLLQLHHVRPRSSSVPPGCRWTLAPQILLAGAIVVVGGTSVPAPEYAGTAAGVILVHVRRPWSWALAGGLVLGATLWTAPSLPWALLAMVAVAALCRLPLDAEQLITARRELGRLAVVRERLRIARNAHDLLGFPLSAIALKAELGRRQTGTDPGAARRHMAEAGRFAEEALSSLRSVTGEPAGLSFAEEVENARSMLTAAGIRVAVELHATPAPPMESPLAIILREAVTNVVRHARATTCEIETWPVPDGVRLRVTNDGVSAAPDATAGTGLANLMSRARDTGGRLDVRRQGDRFTVVAEIHAAAPVTV